MTPTRRSADLERKTAAVAERAPSAVTADQVGLLATAPAPGGPRVNAPHPFYDLSGEPEGTIRAIVAATGTADDVDNVIVPGAFTRTLREREMKGVRFHDWARPVARQLKAIELMPGDPRLPRTLADGVTPWPRAAGALAVKARYLLSTRDGREAWEALKAYGPTAAFSIGYKVAKAKNKGGLRHIYDLDVYECSDVLHGANWLATLQSVESAPGDYEFKVAAVANRVPGQPDVSDARAAWQARVAAPGECWICRKATGGGIVQSRAGENVGTNVGVGGAVVCVACLDQLDWLTEETGSGQRIFVPVPCEFCGQTAGGAQPFHGHSRTLVCLDCIAALDDHVIATGVITRGQLAEAEALRAGVEPSTEEGYEQALADEVEWDVESDGTLVRDTGDRSRGRAWRRDTRQVWGRP